MFRTVTGFKAQYHYLTLLVASDFDEWRIILHGPGVCIQGGRQFTEEKHEDLSELENLGWQPFTSDNSTAPTWQESQSQSNHGWRRRARRAMWLLPRG